MAETTQREGSGLAEGRDGSTVGFEDIGGGAPGSQLSAGGFGAPEGNAASAVRSVESRVFQVSLLGVSGNVFY